MILIKKIDLNNFNMIPFEVVVVPWWTSWQAKDHVKG